MLVYREKYTPLQRMFFGLSFLCIGIAIFGSLSTYPAWHFALHRRDYQPAVFTVISVHVHFAGKGEPFRTASGTIGGHEEEMSLKSEMFTQLPYSDYELATLIPAGTKIEVWYDPAASDTVLTTVNLRVLPRKLYNLDDAFVHATSSTLMWNGPLLIWASVYVVSFIRRRLRPRTQI